MRALARIALAGIGLLVIAGLVSSVTVTTATQVVPAQGGTYSEGLVGRPGLLNPLIAPANPCDNDVTALVFTGLARRDDDGHIAPDLAERWDVSGDARVYTFTLRAGTAWHDGAPVTADDVVFTIKATQAEDALVLPWIAAFWRDVEADKISERVARLTLPQPYAPFLEYATLGLLPAHILATGDGDARERFDQYPIGTGPYRIQERTARRIVLEAFGGAAYPQPMAPRLEFRYYDDRAGALTALKNGDVMAISGVSPAEAADLEKRAGVTVHWARQASQAVVLFNLSLPFFDDAATRRALSNAIDRRALAQKTLAGRAEASDSPFLLSSWANRPSKSNAVASPESAGALLQKAGWSDSDRDGVRERNGVKLEFGLLASNDPAQIAVAREVAQAWTAAGAAVEVQILDAAALAQDYLQPRRFETALFTWDSLPDDPDPYEMWHSSQRTAGGLNFTGLSSQRVDEILEQARRSPDRAERKALYYRFLDIFEDQTPELPLYEPMFGFATSEKVQAVRLSAITTPADRFRHLAEWYVMTRTITTIEKRHQP